MKNALILHGTNATSSSNWFPWLAQQLAAKDYRVWVPDLPHADKPSMKRYNEFLFARPDWEFDNESVIIGHSSGAVAILGLLQQLHENVRISKALMVGAFKDDLGWNTLEELFDITLNFELIKQKSSNFTFIHSDNDPYSPLTHAKYLSLMVGGELIMRPGEGHFNTEMGPSYTQLPFILDLIP